MSPLNDGSLDLPYEEHDETNLTDRFAVASGAVVMAATIPGDEQEEPALIFRFAIPDGSGFWPPILLILTDEQMSQIADLVDQAADTAIRRAAEKR